jgi:hypothetical protein
LLPAELRGPEFVDESLVLVVQPALPELTVLDSVEEGPPHSARRLARVLNRQKRSKVVAGEEIFDIKRAKWVAKAAKLGSEI